MNEAKREAWLRDPVLSPVAEHRPDLGAHVPEDVAIADVVEIGDSWKLLCQRVVAALEFLHLLPCDFRLGEVAGDDDRPRVGAGFGPDRRRGQTHDRNRAVAASVRDVRLGHPLAATQSHEQALRRATFVLVVGQVGEQPAEGLLLGVAVNRLGGFVPGDDLSLWVDSDHGVLGGVSHGAELVLEQIALGGACMQARPEPSSCGSQRQPNGQGGNVAQRFL